MGLKKRSYEDDLKTLWMIILGKGNFSRLIQHNFIGQYIGELVEITENKVWI